ncbi:uncharacterized protein LOC136086498 isoform X1 [Hydra vulgaris]|uniref:Uncharacterized protein LOC136086498 isoform X1 n=1 Tax=Hydra vulgaris TaxID=6087 RepID=A0ABM4CSG8_HYDVU
MSYAVVVFNNDNEVATVSSKWFKASGCVLGSNCRVGKKLQNMLSNHKESEADWISYEVRVLSSNIATSNCQTTSLLNYPLFPDKSAPVSELSFSNSIQTQASLHCSLPCEHHCTHVVAWFEKLFREIQQMRIEQEAINRRFHQHSQCQIENQHEDSNFLNCLPLDSDLDLDQFSMEIDADKEKRTALISYLRKRSDTNVNKTIINILRSLLKDNVLGCYSRDGKSGKKSFALAKGNFVSIIQDVISKVHKGVSIVQINVAISEQLKRLNQRNRSSLLKSAEGTAPEMADIV